MDELFDLEAQEREPEDSDLTLADLRNPDLYPRFIHFHSSWRTGYVTLPPTKLNALVSAYAAAQTSFWPEYQEDVRHMRYVFLDSGAISTLTAVARGKDNEVMAWVEKQEDVIDKAWALHAAGGEQGVVATMDLPAYPSLLEPAGITVETAMDVTFRNTEQMRTFDMPPGWKPVYMAQGGTTQEYVEFLDRLDRLGCLDDVRAGKAWLGIGGARDWKPPALYTLYRAMRKRLGEGHIHALGLSRTREVAYMASRHWIQSSDSSSAVSEVVYNRGPYRITGPRPEYMYDAHLAAAASAMDARIARAIRQAEETDITEQDELFEEVYT